MARDEALPNRWTARGAFTVHTGSLPQTGLGAELGFGFVAPPVLLLGDVAAFAPQPSETAEADASFTLAVLSFRPCGIVGGDDVRFLPCAITELELLMGRGEGLAQPEAHAAYFPRFGAGGEVVFLLTNRVSWTAGGWGVVAPWRPRFVIDDTVPIHRPSAVATRWSTGIALSL